MTTAWVAGATGYTGRSVVQRARELGWHVVAHVRPGSPSAEAWVPRFEALGAQVDRTAWPDIASAVAAARPDVVFALLGTTAAKARVAALAGDDASYAAVDRDLSLALLRATQALPGSPRFVYLSSQGVDGAFRNAYLQARVDVETMVRASGLPWTIARPGFLTGPDRDERRWLERVAATASDGALAALARVGGRGLARRFASLTGDELAQALVAAATDRDQAGAVLDTAAIRDLIPARTGTGS